MYSVLAAHSMYMYWNRIHAHLFEGTVLCTYVCNNANIMYVSFSVFDFQDGAEVLSSNGNVIGKSFAWTFALQFLLSMCSKL